MAFTLPPVHDIAIEIEGRTFEGSWYVVLGDMVVNYNGHTAKAHKGASDADTVAIEVLRDLVRKHYICLDLLPANLPAPVRNAAYIFLNSFHVGQPAHDLVSSFGESVLGSRVHRQLSWLCVNAIGMVAPYWKFMCDSDTPERTYLALRKWLADPSHSVDWALAQSPSIATRNGARVGDCDACRLEPIADAVAKTATYLRTADSLMAVDALLAVASAYDEGCHPQGSHDRFEKWLVFDVLPQACQCKSLE